MDSIYQILSLSNISPELKKISEKVVNSERINSEEALQLYSSSHLSLLSLLATFKRKKENHLNTYFNKNIHIEPTNICVYNCAFCSYSRKKNETNSWEYSIDDILNQVEKYKNSDITEIHIVGGVHPDRDFCFYLNLIKQIKGIMPEIQIKAYTAVELDYMFEKSGIAIEEGLRKLKNAGLITIPGGGAEIFAKEIRNKICPKKTGPYKWLKIHETAHQLGIPTNATILYGHIEKYEHRIDHMERLRELQDKTKGFQAFIPLKYKSKNNALSKIGEVPVIEDLKNYAVSRIFLDNFKHIKAYWPMLGKEAAKISLSYGVDDIDGTIDDSTQIYSMAGAAESKPIITVNEITKIIKEAGFMPVERDSLYKRVKVY